MSSINQLINGILFGCGLIIASLLMKVLFHIGFC